MANSNHKEKDPVNRIAKSLKHHLPDGWAYALLLYQFPTSGKGQVLYLGDGPKPDTLGVMKQFVQKSEPGIAWLNSRDTEWLMNHLKEHDCTCPENLRAVSGTNPASCDRCVAIEMLRLIPKPELTLHDSMAICQRLAKWLTDLNCGWPRIDEQHPQGMDLFEAITGYVEELRSVGKSCRLESEVAALMEIVEGVRGERWSANGRRLVDTPEWCALYVAWKGKAP